MKVPKEIQFLKNVFRKYYGKKPVEPPYRFPRREWGFFPFGGKMMFRHIAFQRRSEINDFFRDTAPMHAYYSTAYYGDPALQPMGDKFKTWMGADLIFDLDADHLDNADEMTYQEQLAEVKKEVKKLLFDFIIKDLGFSFEDVHLLFSGGRGYHIHVRDSDILQVESRARRQIVDYITGRGINTDRFFIKRREYEIDESTSSIGRELPKRTRGKLYKRKIKPKSEGGWIERMYNGKDELINQLRELETNKDRKKMLREFVSNRSLKINNSMINLMVNNIFPKEREIIAYRMLNEDIFDVFPSAQQEDAFLAILVEMTKVNLGGETDEPVTTDIKRLIRCPGSLHGKTGLKVMEVDKEKIDDFDPLRDAVSLSDDPIEVVVTKPTEQYLGGENFTLKEGENEVPLYLAYFLIARRMATLP